MDTLIGKYIIRDTDDPGTAIKALTAETDPKNNALLRWQWPDDRQIKILLLFEATDESPDGKDAPKPDIAVYLRENRASTVITRALAAEYRKPLTGGRKRFVLYPGGFGENRTVFVLRHPTPAITDFVYYQTRVKYQIQYTPIRFSAYQRASLTLTLSDPDHAEALLQDGLWYGLYERHRLLCRYPLDYAFIAGQMTCCIKKEQHLRLMTDEAYAQKVIMEREAEPHGR